MVAPMLMGSSAFQVSRKMDAAAAVRWNHNNKKSSLYMAVNNEGVEESQSTVSRRLVLSSTLKWGVAAAGIVTTTCAPQAAMAAGTTKDDLIADLVASKAKLEPIPSLLEAMEWDSVRTILKTPPVNQLWNLGDSKNTLVLLGKETGEFGLLELKDELSITLQICDQLTYGNAFVYYQPGNGKFKIKEPMDLAKKAMNQIQDAIDMANAA
eukprot:CAMPEP_0198299126 /NCGR_PEP_ID=MMETSP1449-20131203/43484_1 /TAXON_ID=420275 /ORGANISM="Attheya septentrionalis, Strain CCMP2084" /LENGTH=209 /DNA_ID=CAMNT_0044000583 /DNA_START=112 /DNA_END=741 /DNA_ORIENTATION=+